MNATTDPPRHRLLLLDGHSLAYRAFFALPVENFSTTTGQPTNAVYGFTSMLINVLRDEQPTHVAVAFDVSRQTFRTEQYAEYKAGRSETPDRLQGPGRAWSRRCSTALRIPVVEAEGYEADDVIATLTTQAEREGLEVLICTGDRDAFQLVSDQVTVLYPRKGVSDLARMTPAAVEEKYGLTPGAVPRLRGAASATPATTCPASRASGEKTAAKWIARVRRLDGWSPASTRSRARPARRCASTSRRCCATASSPSWSATCRSTSMPGDLARGQLGPRGGAPGLRHPASSGCCATGSTRRSTAAEPEADEGFDVDRPACWARARWPAGWPSTRATGAAPACTSPGTGAAAPAT